MRNILVYSACSDPIFIALSKELEYHMIYQGESVGAHNSIGAAIMGAANEFSINSSAGIHNWQLIQ